MSISEAIILGIVQGLTEFIPVSSTGHLILLRDFLGIQAINPLAFDAVLQLSSALAILVYFSRDLWKFLKDKILLKAILAGTIPAVILGLLLEDFMDTTFRSSGLVALSLIAGAGLMWLAEYVSVGTEVIDTKRGFVVGLFQSLALVPGISRSGATISGGLLAGLNRENATRFSFLLALPIILGSGLKKLFDLHQAGLLSSIGTPLLVGSVASFFFGLVAITLLIRYLKNHKLTPFIWYRLILAAIILVII